jgi:hypothetical protein
MKGNDGGSAYDECTRHASSRGRVSPRIEVLLVSGTFSEQMGTEGLKIVQPVALLN